MNTSSADELTLILNAQRGQVAAFELLVEQQSARLFRSAFTLCRDRQLAEDLVQETFVEAWRALGRFDGRCQFATWLYGILRHRFLKALRKQSPACMESSIGDAFLAFQTDQPSPADLAEQSEDGSLVRKALAELPTEQRLVVELRFFAGANLDEIAEVLACPLGTVKSRLHHALAKLRNMNLSLNQFGSNGESHTRKP